MSLADLKADLAACTLRGKGETPPPYPEIGTTNRRAPERLKRFLIEIPEPVIDKLVFLHFEIADHERDDVVALVTALGRIGRKPTISQRAENMKLLSF